MIIVFILHELYKKNSTTQKKKHQKHSIKQKHV